MNLKTLPLLASVLEKSRLLKVLVLVVVFVWTWLFFAQQISLHNSDLGRHLENGKLLLSQGFDFLKYNSYSYTNPDFPVVTHHWLAGLIFYLVLTASGWYGLSIFYGFVNACAVLLMIAISKSRVELWIRVMITMLVLPLFTIRYEIRPEGFSYLLFAVFFAILELYRERRIRFRWLWLLVPSMLLWVNLHIFFITGIALTGLYFIEEMWKGKKLELKYLWLFFALVASTLVNPFGLFGAIAPLLIFKEYGYPLVENQTVFFLHKRFGSPYYLHFELLAILLIAVSLFVVKKWQKFKVIGGFVFLILMMVGAMKMARLMSLFALVLIPVFSSMAVLLWHEYFKKVKKEWIILGSVGLCLFMLVFGLIFTGNYLSPVRRNYGLGLLPNTFKSADFFKKQAIEGPIFNNYDNGGFLIYALYPDFPVFVDNRPEAYPVEFFQQDYIPMQQDPQAWKQKTDQFGFNAIFFFWHDFTPWGQAFILRATQDPEWVPIYVDEYELILVRNTEKNQPLIAKYQLPREMFVAK